MASTIHPDLFDVGPRRKASRPEFVRQRAPYWTHNKAKLIERYLQQFLFVTKHGTYLDGFAGPQEEDLDSENWAARLVLRLRPQWLKRFVLIEKEPDQVALIREMIRQMPRTPLGKKMRNLTIRPGDVNTELPRYLEDYPVKASEATFCLLDQRTFECEWRTVETVAHHKRGGYKIEIFYFLANSWIQRSMATTKETKRIDAWWGGKEWNRLKHVGSWERASIMRGRFEELGYKYVVPLPIYNRYGGTRIMYFMIHASDHPAAPVLMRRAYQREVEPLDTQEAIQIELAANGVDIRML